MRDHSSSHSYSKFNIIVTTINENMVKYNTKYIFLVNKQSVIFWNPLAEIYILISIYTMINIRICTIIPRRLMQRHNFSSIHYVNTWKNDKKLYRKLSLACAYRRMWYNRYEGECLCFYHLPLQRVHYTLCTHVFSILLYFKCRGHVYVC